MKICEYETTIFPPGKQLLIGQEKMAKCYWK